MPPDPISFNDWQDELIDLNNPANREKQDSKCYPLKFGDVGIICPHNSFGACTLVPKDCNNRAIPPDGLRTGRFKG